MPRVRVLYFGQAKEITGLGEEEFAVPQGARVERVVEEAAGRHSKLSRLVGSMRVALNEEVVRGGETLEEGDVVALLPPVAGG